MLFVCVVYLLVVGFILGFDSILLVIYGMVLCFVVLWFGLFEVALVVFVLAELIVVYCLCNWFACWL